MHSNYFLLATAHENGDSYPFGTRLFDMLQDRKSQSLEHRTYKIHMSSMFMFMFMYSISASVCHQLECVT